MYKKTKKLRDKMAQHRPLYLSLRLTAGQWPKCRTNFAKYQILGLPYSI